MRVLENSVELVFPGREILGKAAGGEDIGLGGGDGEGFWEEERKGIEEAYREILRVLSGGQEGSV